MFHGHLHYFQKPPLGGKPNTKLRDYGTPNAHNRWFILILSCVKTYMNRHSLQQHLVEVPVTYDFTLHLRVLDHAAWFWSYDREEPVEVQECRRITDHFRGSYRIYPKLIKENRRMSTCNRLDLETLGSQPIVPKNLPNHCFGGVFGDGFWTLSFGLSQFHSHGSLTRMWSEVDLCFI
jgi:hypothetical protein